MRIRILLATFDVGPDPTFRFDAVLDPSFQIKAQIKTLKKCSNRLIFLPFWLVICKLIRIRIRYPFQLDADPDPQHTAHHCDNSEQCGGSGMFIPDPNCLHLGSRILINEFKYFNPKKAKTGF
jgi:hypothetical protein